ncbi:hypothetical protein WA026_003964 [Henosepilachna vigintioctopunctata]|uniref:Uncharacterized protein n=1 Tax=Henosepilachna vigintioctopunctata TaxID=420089 RepID=A0AAW1UHC3_9CUCU
MFCSRIAKNSEWATGKVMLSQGLDKVARVCLEGNSSLQAVLKAMRGVEDQPILRVNLRETKQNDELKQNDDLKQLLGTQQGKNINSEQGTFATNDFSLQNVT